MRFGVIVLKSVRHLAIISIGILWGAIAVASMGCFGLTAAEAVEIAPRFIAAAIPTSYAVTRLFRRQLSSLDVRKKYWLPFATIPCAVGLWTVLLFSLAAAASLSSGRQDVFDGFWLFLMVGLGLTLTAALPITYPLAYITQVVIHRVQRRP